MKSNRVPSEFRLNSAVDSKLEVFAAEGEETKLRRFNILAYTGGAMRVEGWPDPVVVELSGLKVSKKPRPVLRDHDPGRVVGHTDKIEVTSKEVNVTGVVSGANGEAEEIVSAADNGFPWQASIRATPEQVVAVDEDESVTANGRKFSGPLYLIKRSVLKEVSFVALGADDNTSADLAASAAASQVGVISMKFDDYLKENGFEDITAISEKQLSFLKASYAASVAPPSGGNGKPSDPQPPDAKSSLDDFVASQKRDMERRSRIDAIASDMIRERPFQIDEIKRFADDAKADATRTADSFELELLRAVRPQTGALSGRRKDREGGRYDNKVVTAAICASLNMRSLESQFDERTLALAHDHYPHGLGLQELLLTAAADRDCHYHRLTNGNLRQVLTSAFADIKAFGFSTISLPSILESAANKLLIDAFNAVENTWREITDIASVSDFRQINGYSLTGNLEYEKVGATGDIKHGTLGDEAYSNQAHTYGKMLAITRRDLINDDLNAFAAIPRRLGRGGALAINRVFWTEFMDNSTFFTAARGNYDDGTDTALDAAGLKTAIGLFNAITDPDGEAMAVEPRILLVPPGQEFAARELMESAGFNTGGSATTAQVPSANVLRGRLRIVVSRYLANSNYTGYSALAYYILADPSDVPVIQTVFLNGRQTPIIESAEADFNTLGVQFRGYHDFGVAKQEYRGGFKAKGEA